MSIDVMQKANATLGIKLHEAERVAASAVRERDNAIVESATWKGAAAGLAKQRDAFLKRLHEQEHSAVDDAGPECPDCVAEIRSVEL